LLGSQVFTYFTTNDFKDIFKNKKGNMNKRKKEKKSMKGKTERRTRNQKN
jgi:hypothetical protein